MSFYARAQLWIILGTQSINVEANCFIFKIKAIYYLVLEFSFKIITNVGIFIF